MTKCFLLKGCVAAATAFVIIIRSADAVVDENRSLTRVLLPKGIPVVESYDPAEQLQYRRLDGESSSSTSDSWISSYSMQFQGCHDTLQYRSNSNNNNNKNNNNHGGKIYNRRLVRFSLCSGCSSTSTYTNSTTSSSSTKGTCTNGAGEYVLDMHVFLSVFVKSQMTFRKATCQSALSSCGCSQGDDDSSSTSSCAQKCFASDNSLGYCFLLQQIEELNFEDLYLECTAIKLNNHQYFVGPYCSDDGSQILLSIFTDNSCSIEAGYGTWTKYNNNNNDFSKFFTYYSPLGNSNSIVGFDCVSCAADSTDDNVDDKYSSNGVKQMCDYLYQQSGKCETSSAMSYPNTDACNYIEGIKMTLNDGRVVYKERPSKATGAWIGIFAMSTIVLGAYVYYLQVKVHHAIVQLNHDIQDSNLMGYNIGGKSSTPTINGTDNGDNDYYYT
eukprot:CAMPEP_0172417432 /NCGR_PEP_ID=MMETSP1064-20121228/3952_1 /TAXON_ID=202472 /ORGANISM="Aulacoseira subarctica , Strain CCAP 1002/5" /LENGTH=441 /DNA_ID=CAMNT_0013155761 /DNA_START=36 /DNA_END=1361 /DNA_ORIENTATION=-